MKCFSLILGARNTPSAGKKFSGRDEDLIRQITARHFPLGFTVLGADGGWFDPKQKFFVKEESRQILICTNSHIRLRDWCRELAKALGQKQLLVVELGPAHTFRINKKR
ncbi:MAG TPA: hypothetical protein VKC60_13265 [Opitutaceae bacterium]|nr:hypothetical protein [Opitutaceae bacterium]